MARKRGRPRTIPPVKRLEDVDMGSQVAESANMNYYSLADGHYRSTEQYRAERTLRRKPAMFLTSALMANEKEDYSTMSFQKRASQPLPQRSVFHGHELHPSMERLVQGGPASGAPVVKAQHEIPTRLDLAGGDEKRPRNNWYSKGQSTFLTSLQNAWPITWFIWTHYPDGVAGPGFHPGLGQSTFWVRYGIPFLMQFRSIVSESSAIKTIRRRVKYQNRLALRPETLQERDKPSEPSTVFGTWGVEEPQDSKIAPAFVGATRNKTAAAGLIAHARSKSRYDGRSSRPTNRDPPGLPMVAASIEVDPQGTTDQPFMQRMDKNHAAPQLQVQQVTDPIAYYNRGHYQPSTEQYYGPEMTWYTNINSEDAPLDRSIQVPVHHYDHPLYSGEEVTDSQEMNRAKRRKTRSLSPSGSGFAEFKAPRRTDPNTNHGQYAGFHANEPMSLYTKPYIYLPPIQQPIRSSSMLSFETDFLFSPAVIQHPYKVPASPSSIHEIGTEKSTWIAALIQGSGESPIPDPSYAPLPNSLFSASQEPWSASEDSAPIREASDEEMCDVPEEVCVPREQEVDDIEVEVDFSEESSGEDDGEELGGKGIDEEEAVKIVEELLGRYTTLFEGSGSSEQGRSVVQIRL